VNVADIAAAGDQALRVRLDADDDGAVRAATERLLRARPPGVTDVVPGYGSLLVVYDALLAAPDDVRAWIAATAPGDAVTPAARTVEIPVAYDPELAPDLAPLAAEKQISVGELIARHAAPLYRCRLLGFRPGFPFLWGLDEGLASARLPSPRLRVPAGAVGIGGSQTGVYPVESPGGWRLVGRTPLRLFDPARAEPFLVRAGDHVRFVPIDRATFERMQA
jgi:KipI family sensor histidine kinase inhibitor